MRFWLLLSLFLMGCTNSKNSCGNSFLVLWPDAQGEYALQKLTLSTLPSPYELKGAAAEIYVENAMSGQGFRGPVAEPRFTGSDGTCVPLDVKSSMAIALYAQFEQLYLYEQELGISEMISWPRRVGVNIGLVPVDSQSHNNAHYFSEADAIAVLPYSLNGVPLSQNHGVIAHEHFHGHFQRQVLDEMNRVLSTEQTSLEALFYPEFVSLKPTEDMSDMSRAGGANNYVLRAWNEGLADLYAAIFTGNPEFFSQSLPNLKVTRALTSRLEPLGTSQDILRTLSPGGDPSSLVGFSYMQGSYLARLLYQLAHSGVESPRQFMVRIMRRLHAIAPAILPEYNQRIMDIETVVPILLDGFELNAAACAALTKSISKNLRVRSYPQCSGS